MFCCLFYIIWMLAGINQVISFEISCNVSTSTLQTVEQCPTDEKSYREAESRKNCASISNTCKSFDYHCVMNAWRNATVEVCAPSLFIIGGVCAEYSEYFMSIRSSERSCENFSEPCSSRYKSTEQYKYPGCYNIANTAYTSVHIPTTDLPQSFSESASTESTSQTNIPSLIDAPLQKIQGLSAGATTGIVLAVLVVFFICLLIAFFFYVKGKMIKENRSCQQVIAAIPFCCQRVYEGCIMLKIQDLMDKRYGRVDVCDPGSRSTLAVTPEATSSAPLLSNQENDENNKTTDSNETYEKQIVKNDVNNDKMKSDVHPSIEHFIPPSTSEAQNFDLSSASPLEVSLQPNQQSEASSFVSSLSHNKPSKSQGQEIHQNTPKTDQLVSSFCTPSSSTKDQPPDTSYHTLQGEPVDPSISPSEVEKSPLFQLDKDPPDSPENCSLDFTPVSVPTRPLENSTYDSQNSSTVKSPEGTKVTSSLSSSTFHGSGDSETPQKKCFVHPESPEASSKLATAAGQTGLQPENINHINLGKRMAIDTPPNTPKLSTSEGAEGGVLTDRMHGDNIEIEVDINDAVNSMTRDEALARAGGITPIYYQDSSTENSTRIEALEDKLDTVLKELKTVNASMSQLHLSYTNAHNDLCSTKEELLSAKKELHDAEKKFETAAEELRKTRDQLQSQHQALCNKDKEIEDLRVEVCEKDRLLCVKERKLREQQQELMDKDRIINDKDRIINDKQRQNIEKEAELAERERELCRELQMKENEIKEQKERIRQLQDQQHKEEKIVESLEEEIRKKASDT